MGTGAMLATLAATALRCTTSSSPRKAFIRLQPGALPDALAGDRCSTGSEEPYARLEGLQTLAMPVAAVCACSPPFQASTCSKRPFAAVPRPLRGRHAGLYSLFTLAALHAMLMAMAERSLHSARDFTAPIAALPPLLTRNPSFRLIGIAFVLLTLTVGSGILFSGPLRQSLPLPTTRPFRDHLVAAFRQPARQPAVTPGAGVAKGPSTGPSPASSH